MRPCPQYQPSLGLEPARLVDLQGLGNTLTTGTRSGGESRLGAMAKLFNNAGDKPILPSFLKPPIAIAKPSGSGVSQRTNLAFWGASSAAYDQVQRKPASAWRCRFRRADKPSPPSARCGLLSCYSSASGPWSYFRKRSGGMASPELPRSTPPYLPSSVPYGAAAVAMAFYLKRRNQYLVLKYRFQHEFVQCNNS